MQSLKARASPEDAISRETDLDDEEILIICDQLLVEFDEQVVAANEYFHC